MSRALPLHSGLGALVVAGLAVAGSPGDADARMTVLDDDAATISRAIAARPGGGSGLRLDDGLFQLPSAPGVLPSSRQIGRVAGTASTTSSSALVGRGATGMAALLRDRVRRSGARQVLVDELGPAFAGKEGEDLAAALGTLARERPSYAPSGVSRRVHFYVSDAGALLSSPSWAGARLATVRSGGLWMKTFSGETEWDPAQWLAWPAEASAQFSAAGASRTRVHVVFAGGFRQTAAWTLGRTGSACATLGNGPGGYRLGADVDEFVAEFRSTLPIKAVSKDPVVGCTGAPALSAAGARGLASAAGSELTGLPIPEGGLMTPPLPAGEPAQLTLQLGPDPLGLAVALGVSPEQFWTAARARLEVRAPGSATDVTVEGDGSARIEFTPTAPGPVTMRLVIDQGTLSRALGAEPEVVAPLRAAGVDPALVRRVVADPSGWTLQIPLVQPGGTPGDPVLEIVPLPT